MSDDIRNFRITGEDIEGVRSQLSQLHSSLSEGQQHVLEWLLQRASEAPAEEEVSGYNFRIAQQGTTVTPGLSAFGNPGQNFYSSLGMSQLGHMGRVLDAADVVYAGVMF